MQKLGGPMVIVIVVLVLLGVGTGAVALLWPSLSGGGSTTSLTAITTSNPILSHPDGLRVAVEPAQISGEYKVGMQSVPSDAYLSGRGNDVMKAARRAMPGNLVPISPVFALSDDGPPPTLLAIALPLGPADTLRDQAIFGYYADAGWTYLPGSVLNNEYVAQVNVLPDVVALMQYAPAVSVAATTLELNDTLGDVASAINIVSPAGLELQANGTLTGSVAGGFGLGQGYSVMPLVRGSAEAVNAMLADATATQTQIASVVDLVMTGNYNGVVLDYRGLDPARSPAFTSFVKALKAELARNNRTLVVVVPQPIRLNGSFTAQGYDLARLASAADGLEIALADDPAQLKEEELRAMLSWLVVQTDRNKLRLRTSANSLAVVNGQGIRIGYSEAISPLGGISLVAGGEQVPIGSQVDVSLENMPADLYYNAEMRAQSFTYVNEAGETVTVYIAAPAMLAFQLQLASDYLLGGVSVEDLFNPDSAPGMVDALVQYKINAAAAIAQSQPEPLSFDVKLDGNMIASGPFDATGLLTFIVEQPGTYEVVARLGSDVVDTLTVSTLAETATPTVTPTPTATLGPIYVNPNPGAPAPNPGAGGGGGAPAPTATPVPQVISGGGAWGNFELGGQVVHGGIPHAQLMRDAGMTWVKLQARDFTDMKPAIDAAHGAGFKIMLTVLTSNHSAIMDPTYQQQVADYCGQLAAQGADAIEVWNEPNIEVEWPPASINGANYVPLLQKSYAAIKAANPNTIVISAAPAPTGYFGAAGCGATGCNDDVYLQQFVDAGGAQYMDCIGIHYNEGIISPTEIGTDPRDNHYTRYYQTMVNTYANIFQNSRPLCFTELGYLSPEGQPGALPPNFGWAGNTTNAQHAQWLGEAASLARNSGAVRIMIVFNVDLTTWSDRDPQAGYAILRPDGSCPACSTLRAAVP